MVRIALLSALAAAALVAAPLAAQTTHRRTTPVRRAAPSSGLAGAWHSVYTDPTVSVAIDTTQTQRLGNGTFKTRLRWRYTSSQPIGRHESYRTLVERKLIDCKSLGVKPVAAITYDAAGRPVSSYNTPDSEVAVMDWARRDVGSSAAKAYQAMCGMLR